SPKLSSPGAAPGRLAKRTSSSGHLTCKAWEAHSLRVRQFSILTAGHRFKVCGFRNPHETKSPVCPKHTGANSAWCSSNMPGLGPGDRRCFAFREANVSFGETLCKTWEVQSCRADQFQSRTVRLACLSNCSVG